MPMYTGPGILGLGLYNILFMTEHEKGLDRAKKLFSPLHVLVLLSASTSSFSNHVHVFAIVYRRILL